MAKASCQPPLPEPEPTSNLLGSRWSRHCRIKLQLEVFLSSFHGKISKNYFENKTKHAKHGLMTDLKRCNIYNSQRWGIEKEFLVLLGPKLVINCNSHKENGWKEQTANVGPVCRDGLQRCPILWTDGNVWSFICLSWKHISATGVLEPHWFPNVSVTNILWRLGKRYWQPTGKCCLQKIKTFICAFYCLLLQSLVK